MNTVGLLAQSFLSAHPDRAARILERHGVVEVARLLEAQPPREVAALLQGALPLSGADYLSEMDPEKASAAVSCLNPEQALRLLRHLSADRRERLISALPEAEAAAYRRMLKYPIESAGAHMNPFVVALPEDLTVVEAMQRVRRLRRDAFYFPYVVDREQKLVGILTVRELMLARPRQRLSEVMRREVVRVPLTATRRDLARISGWRAYQSMPVVDARGILVGVLRQEAVKELEASASPEYAERSLADGFVTVVELYMRTLGAMVPVMASAAGAAMHREHDGRSHARRGHPDRA